MWPFEFSRAAEVIDLLAGEGLVQEMLRYSSIPLCTRFACRWMCWYYKYTMYVIRNYYDVTCKQTKFE